MPTFTSIAPHMGITVRFTKSKGDTLPMPEATTITAVMGEQVRAMEAAKCIGNKKRTGAIPLACATAGVRAANAKKGALPEPITTEDTAMMDTMTTIINMGEKPAF